MIPAEWKYRVAGKTQEQFDCIKKLFFHPATKEIICATDAGREGQHIFDLIRFRERYTLKRHRFATER